mmetsp:Transcript_41392/g.133126  ORF Transcript_41392/g.133126 Transcript_41392/m.133126 type:complete len:219 (-) Transcript_41392:1335-1991(-)
MGGGAGLRDGAAQRVRESSCGMRRRGAAARSALPQGGGRPPLERAPVRRTRHLGRREGGGSSPAAARHRRARARAGVAACADGRYHRPAGGPRRLARAAPRPHRLVHSAGAARRGARAVCPVPRGQAAGVAPAARAPQGLLRAVGAAARPAGQPAHIACPRAARTRPATARRSSRPADRGQRRRRRGVRAARHQDGAAAAAAWVRARTRIAGGPRLCP